MKSVPRLPVFLALMSSLILAGCASTGDSGPPAKIPKPLATQVEESLPHTDPDVLYYVGAAEIAGMREEFKLSAELYARAADIANDPQIAAQAVKVAAFANDEDLTLKGVDRWLALQPDHPEPHRVASILFLRRNDAEQAWGHISAILDRQPPIERWDAIIKMLAATRNRATALTVLRQIIETYEIPRHEALLTQMSDLALRTGDLELADKMATLTLEVNPHNPESYSWRGRLRSTMNRLDEARVDIEKALELDPDNDQMRQTYAALLADFDDFEGAIAQLEMVEDSMVVVFSKAVYAREGDDLERAKVYYLDLQELPVEDENERYFFLGQLSESLELPYRESVDWYDQVRSGDRMDASRLRSAVLLGKNGEFPKARVILKRLQNGNARTATNAYLAEAGLLRDIELQEDALMVYGSALELLPDNTDLLFARALLAEQLDQLELAETDLRKVLDLNPDDPNALNALGYTLADRTDRYDEALVMIEKALGQMPNEPAFVDSMGWVQYKLGNYEDALSYLERALELQYDSEIAAHLGEVLWVMGRHDDARELWSEALEREPDSPILQETMARLASQ